MADPNAAALNPQPIPPGSNRVRIFVNREVAYDINKMNRVTATVLGKLGCPNCHSGRILDYRMIEDFVVNPKTLEVNEFTGGF